MSVNQLGSMSIIDPGNIFALAGAVCRYTGENYSNKNLRQCFLKSVNRLQKFQFRFNEVSEEIYMDFGDSSTSNLSTFQHIMDTEKMEVGWQYHEREVDQIIMKTKDALDFVKKNFPSIRAGIDIIIGSFLYAKLRGFQGGSISDIIGAVWLGPSLEWSVIDYAERIVHEYVHQCLFLDEMVNTIFSKSVPRMAMTDGLVVSSILKHKRGYDKSFHSAFVATILLYFYHKLKILPKVDTSPNSILLTIRDLKAKSYFLTSHGKKILLELQYIVENTGQE